MKNSLEGRPEQAADRINELEDRTIEITKAKGQKEKKTLKKSEQKLRDL